MAKVQLFVRTHKHFRRNVSKSPVFLIKVKNIYILITKTGYFKAFALSGRQACCHYYPRRCPGLGASALSGRAAKT